MEQSILVGVTDSAVSRRVVDWVSARALERGCRIELVSVVGGAVGVVGEGPIVEAAMKSAGILLEREVEFLRSRGVVAETRIVRGDPVGELIDSSMVFDLLAIGSDYRGSAVGPRRGPHGVRIAAGAHCPVVVVPDMDMSGRRGIVVGVDRSPIARRALAFAFAEAERSGDPLTVLHTWQPVPLPRTMRGYPHGYLSGVQTLAEETVDLALAEISPEHPGVRITRVVEQGPPAQRLNELASHARLAVVGSHGRGALARFLLGSTSQQVLDELSTVTAVVR
ncbi:universal stress protein [Microbacterium sp. SD291]|nr:universal stress protein [Microbacterium sp. SD291]